MGFFGRIRRDPEKIYGLLTWNAPFRRKGASRTGSQPYLSRQSSDAMTATKFLRWVNTPPLMRYFLFRRLPAAWFLGLRVESCDGAQAVVRLDYGWRSRNPFRSIYFAAQCAAGELSTGLLAMAALQEAPPVSMLVTRVEAEFLKKADKTLRFTCAEGPAVQAAIARAVSSGEPQVLPMTSEGRLPDGQVAARVVITWSFKRR
jgi:hypothetical protein